MTANYKSASFKNFLKARYAFALSVGVLSSMQSKGSDTNRQIITTKSKMILPSGGRYLNRQTIGITKIRP